MKVHRLNQLNFQTLSQKQLHDYVLAHREEREAFYDYYVYKLHAEGKWIEMPALEPEQD